LLLVNDVGCLKTRQHEGVTVSGDAVGPAEQAARGGVAGQQVRTAAIVCDDERSPDDDDDEKALK
jgi:hypothetical protein